MLKGGKTFYRPPPPLKASIPLEQSEIAKKLQDSRVFGKEVAFKPHEKKKENPQKRRFQAILADFDRVVGITGLEPVTSYV